MGSPSLRESRDEGANHAVRRPAAYSGKRRPRVDRAARRTGRGTPTPSALQYRHERRFRHRRAVGSDPGPTAGSLRPRRRAGHGLSGGRDRDRGFRGQHSDRIAGRGDPGLHVRWRIEVAPGRRHAWAFGQWGHHHEWRLAGTDSVGWLDGRGGGHRRGARGDRRGGIGRLAIAEPLERYDRRCVRIGCRSGWREWLQWRQRGWRGGDRRNIAGAPVVRPDTRCWIRDWPGWTDGRCRSLDQ